MLSSRHKAALLLALVIVFIIMNKAHATDFESSDNQQSLQARDSGISTKLLHMRRILKSLFSEWNSGESDLKGAVTSVARTFGRIRMMRQIMLPLVFIGGFMTAVIFSIKITGIVNMLLISKVLLLQLGIVLGKIVYGAKDLLLNKHGHHEPPQAYYIPVSHGYSHGSSYASSREDDSVPNFYANQQLINSPGVYGQPQFNQHMNYPISFSQPQPMPQPQTGLFSGSAPKQIRSTPQFTQPYYQGRTHDASSSSYEMAENAISQELGALQSTLSPQEMTQLLTDAIARMTAARTASRSVYKRSPNILDYNR